MKCKVFKQCGGCSFEHDKIEFHNQMKEKRYAELMGKYPNQQPSIFMKNPYFYRHKVLSTYKYQHHRIFSGLYQSKSHKVVDTSECLIENKTAQAIQQTIKEFVSRYKIPVFDEDKGTGILRHVLIRVGYQTKEVMVILVCAQKEFKSQRLFVKALIQKHPEITTIVLNYNPRRTSVVLSSQSATLYGPGFIYDKIGDFRFKLSPESFYQVNPEQTEILYKKALQLANIQKDEVVLDAYCGIGTITLLSSQYSKQSIGVELNPKAIKDALINKRLNRADNVLFFEQDATEFLSQLESNIDVLIMDPPRNGSTKEFLDNVKRLAPNRLLYISCNPVTLSRDIEMIRDEYSVVTHLMVDQFPFTDHVETIALLQRVGA
ncbi:MAG: 23S rRNA (uracil(1939)-C(5))-methyltransferase RlmD [Erysipelothrix sp.]|nr:23S rRNA (uracil(1939)-C(5))-methyltransferase RlmD [Erysipelothrix sp.]